VGELEFGKQLRDILRTLKPERLLIEPSGAGHAADIVDELVAYESQRALSLDSVICLVDAMDAARLLTRRDTNEWSQIQSADVLLLSKADLAGAPEHAAFAQIVAEQYPSKPCIGSVKHGELPAEALARYSRAPGFSLLRPAATSSAETREFALAGLMGTETQIEQLGLWAVAWILPPELKFARVVLEPRLDWLLHAHHGAIRRFKAVFRTGPGPSWLIQSHGRGLHAEDSAYRRDSRIEIVVAARPSAEFLDGLRMLLRDAVS
jgi:G3E family GTPase